MSSAIMQHFSNLVGYAYEGTGGIVYALNRTVSRDTSVAEQYPGRVTNMYNYNDKVYAWSPLQAVAHASPHPSTISAAGQGVATVVAHLADAVLASSPFPSRAEDSANTSAPPSAADDSTQVEENLFCFIFFLGSLVLLVSLCVTVLAVYFGFVRPRMVEEEAMYKALAKEAEEAEAAREAERAAARAAASNARASAAHTQGKASNASSSGGALLTGPRSMPSQRALSSRSGSRTDLRTGPVLPQPQQNPFAAPLSRNPSIVGASPGLAPPPPTPPLWVGHVGSRSNMGSFVFQQPPPPTQLPPPPLPFLQPQLQPQLELRPQPQLPPQPQPQQAPAWEEEGQQPLRRRTSRVSFKANITESM